MSGLVLDTTVVVDYLRGREAARQRVLGARDQGEDIWVCAITVEEVTRGIRPREDDPFLQLLKGLRLAPLGIEEGRLAGFWRRTHARHGVTISQPDALVAAAAIGVNARLATGNPKDFPMANLVVEHWPVNE